LGSAAMPRRLAARSAAGGLAPRGEAARRSRWLSALQARDEIVQPGPRDRQELREVLTIALREGRRAISVTDGAREIGERLVELARRGDERVVAQRRDRRLGPLALRLRI